MGKQIFFSYQLGQPFQMMRYDNHLSTTSLDLTELKETIKKTLLDVYVEVDESTLTFTTKNSFLCAEGFGKLTKDPD